MTFKRNEDATKILSVENHRLFDVNVRIWVANELAPLPGNACGNERTEEGTVSVQTSAIDLSLNDDCLDQIFRMLPLSDLIAISQTCSRLRAIAVKIFVLRPFIDLNAFTDRSGRVDIATIKIALMNFGSVITRLKYNNINEEQKPILDLILKYCGGSLKSLALLHIHVKESMVPAMRALFSQLETLHLLHLKLDESVGSVLFSDCNQLVELKATELSISQKYYICKAVLTNSYPKLKRFTLKSTYEHSTENLLQKFLQNHNQLEALSLNKLNLLTSDKLIAAFTNNSNKNMKSLCLNSFTFGSEHMPVLRNIFKSLKTLNLKESQVLSQVPSILFSECNQLRILKVTNLKDLLSDSSVKFPQLKFLTFAFWNSLWDAQSAELLKAFLNENLQLEGISVKLSRGSCDWLLEFIADKMVQLRKLHIFCKNWPFPVTLKMSQHTALAKIGSIKKLRIFSHSDLSDIFNKMTRSADSLVDLQLGSNLSQSVITAIAESFKNLRQLEISNGDNEDSHSKELLLEPLGNLPQLRVLKVGGQIIIANEDLHNFVTKAENLRLLNICVRDFEMDSATYKSMIEIVHNRNQVLSIVVEKWSRPKYCFDAIYLERDVCLP